MLGNEVTVGGISPEPALPAWILFPPTAGPASFVIRNSLFEGAGAFGRRWRGKTFFWNIMDTFYSYQVSNSKGTFSSFQDWWIILGIGCVVLVPVHPPIPPLPRVPLLPVPNIEPCAASSKEHATSPGISRKLHLSITVMHWGAALRTKLSNEDPEDVNLLTSTRCTTMPRSNAAKPIRTIIVLLRWCNWCLVTDAPFLGVLGRGIAAQL